MRYAMMIDLDECVGCQACVSSCKERWDSGPGAARDWVMTFAYGARDEGDLSLAFYPGLCNHCDDHPCTEDCPTGATYQDEHGVVVVDPDVCIGCGNCVPKCPYGARHADAKKGIVEKCNFCSPHVARGEQPACVATCLAECRHFGDVDDPNSEVSRLIRERHAKPLTTNEIDVGPRVYYAPPDKRLQVLAQSVVRRYDSTLFTHLYRDVTRPVARWGIAPLIALAAAGGMLVNLRMYLQERRQQRAPAAPSEDRDAPATAAPPLQRHAAGMRFLHWFNLLSWVLLLSTGTALMATAGFALFGTGFADKMASWVGGRGNLIWLHAVWGLLWATIIVPLFLYFKRGGIEAIREIWPTYDDLAWMWIKPLVLLGLRDETDLPPQDKYNFGQKLFAISAMSGTAIIIASGLVMTFHLGDAPVVRTAIMIHKLAVMLALVGIAVHVTMAAILVEERPALWSMIVGQIDRRHAQERSAKWVAQLESQPSAKDHAASDELTPAEQGAKEKR
jgi:formate dehydrogenase gamma subunit